MAARATRRKNKKIRGVLTFINIATIKVGNGLNRSTDRNRTWLRTIIFAICPAPENIYRTTGGIGGRVNQKQSHEDEQKHVKNFMETIQLAYSVKRIAYRPLGFYPKRSTLTAKR